MSLRLHQEPLQDAWLDAYGHLNEAYYLVPFSNATWKLQDHLGIGVAWFDATGGAIYTVETHLRYLREVRAPAMLEVESMLLGFDAKRLHIAHLLHVEDTLRATFECIGLHVDSKSGRTAAMPDDVLKRLAEACEAVVPDWSGRKVSLVR